MAAALPASCVVRRVDADLDWGRGLSDLLLGVEKSSQPSSPTQSSAAAEAAFRRQLERMAAVHDHYAVYVVEETGRIVAMASLFVELKFIHALGKVGHIEDVLVDAARAGDGLDRHLVSALVAQSRERGCYKTIAACRRDDTARWLAFGFARKGKHMCMEHGADGQR